VTYGLNRRSVLNKSRFYHVVGGLPPDAMHDILEGVLQYHAKELLKFYVQTENKFTLEELNKRITSFDYGYVF
jgi:Mg2+/Co2+ transporter CorC